MTHLSLIATEVEGELSTALVPPIAIGLLALGVLMALLFTAFAFRSVGTRH